MKLDGNLPWRPVRNYADKKHGLKLNFPSSHTNCFSAWKYTTKGDREYLESEHHPDENGGKRENMALVIALLIFPNGSTKRN